MGTTLSSVIRKVKMRMKDGWYIDIPNEQIREIWNCVFEYLGISKELSGLTGQIPIDKSINADTVSVLKLYKGTGHTPVAELAEWFLMADNERSCNLNYLCMIMDSDDDYDPKTEELVYGERYTAIRTVYNMERWEILEKLDKYMTENYGPVFLEQDIFSDEENYYYFESEYGKIPSLEEKARYGSCREIPVQAENEDGPEEDQPEIFQTPGNCGMYDRIEDAISAVLRMKHHYGTGI
ncbi:MAG: hypothetical protein LUF27_13330 [Lachnospiraceae bacterium]|nr:hypothetical protein [Lachnospiraceae bacterium]